MSAIARVRAAVASWRTASAERGQILVLFALGAFVLVGAVGLGVDGSRLLEERRKSQAAADQAALTAARLLCKTPASTMTDAENAGRPIAAANGFQHDPPTTEVQFTIATGTGTDGSPVTVTINSHVDATFARAVGITTLRVSTSATAQGKNCGAAAGSAGPGRAVYSGGTCSAAGKYAFENSGSNNQVYGGVHANDDVSVSGSGNKFTEIPPPDDPFTYVGTMNPGAGNTYQSGYPALVPMPSPQWPSGWAPSDVTGATTGDPGAGTFLKPYYDLAVANGTFFTSKITSIAADGVYYTTATDGVDIGSVSGTTRNITIISTRGTIKVSDSGTIFNAFSDPSLPRAGILLLSGAAKAEDKRCEEFTVAVSGSDVAWNGIIWAPLGQIEFSGSTNVTAAGALVGWSVKLNGSNLVIRFADTTTTGVTPTEIILIQ